jgi:hypothetical protein
LVPGVEFGFDLGPDFWVNEIWGKVVNPITVWVIVIGYVIFGEPELRVTVAVVHPVYGVVLGQTGPGVVVQKLVGFVDFDYLAEGWRKIRPENGGMTSISESVGWGHLSPWERSRLGGTVPGSEGGFEFGVSLGIVIVLVEVDGDFGIEGEFLGVWIPFVDAEVECALGVEGPGHFVFLGELGAGVVVEYLVVGVGTNDFFENLRDVVPFDGDITVDDGISSVPVEGLGRGVGRV